MNYVALTGDNSKSISTGINCVRAAAINSALWESSQSKLQEAHTASRNDIN